MKDAIYHNPRCSKSRQTLALLEGRGVAVPVVEYLEQPPGDDARWLEVLAGHPALLERPIVVYKGKAALGRPPENVLKIL